MSFVVRFQKRLIGKDRSRVLWLLMWVILVHAAVACRGASADLPSASSVIARVVERASQIAKEGEAKYLYEKRSLFEELNAHRQTTRSTEKIYEVMLIGGWPFSRLVKVQGRSLTPAEIRSEDQKEQEFRNKVAGRNLGAMAEKKEPWLLPEIVDRYEFTVLGTEEYDSRRTVVLEFKAKPGNAERNMQDKIYDRFAGKLWVDQGDAEIAKLEVHLTEEFSLGWLGLFGSLSECDLSLKRQRMPDGTWVNAKSTILIVGRKVFSPMRYRTTEESSGFRAPSAEKGQTGP